jgi:hypothetical protein
MRPPFRPFSGPPTNTTVWKAVTQRFRQGDMLEVQAINSSDCSGWYRNASHPYHRITAGSRSGNRHQR